MTTTKLITPEQRQHRGAVLSKKIKDAFKSDHDWPTFAPADLSDVWATTGVTELLRWCPNDTERKSWHEFSLSAVSIYDAANRLFVDAFLVWAQRNSMALDWQAFKESRAQRLRTHVDRYPDLKKDAKSFFTTLINETAPGSQKAFIQYLKRRVLVRIGHAVDEWFTGQSLYLAACVLDKPKSDFLPPRAFLELCKWDEPGRVFSYAIFSFLTIPPIKANSRGRRPNDKWRHDLRAPHIGKSIAEIIDKLTAEQFDFFGPDVCERVKEHMMTDHGIDPRLDGDSFKPLRIDAIASVEALLLKKKANASAIAAFRLAVVIAHECLNPFLLIAKSNLLPRSTRSFIERWHHAIDPAVDRDRSQYLNRKAIYSELLEVNSCARFRANPDAVACSVRPYVSMLVRAQSRLKRQADQPEGAVTERPLFCLLYDEFCNGQCWNGQHIQYVARCACGVAGDFKA